MTDERRGNRGFRSIHVSPDFRRVNNPHASPSLFGISNEPSKDHAEQVYPLLAESGFRFQRGTIHVNRLFDERFPDATLTDWVQNTGGMRDPGSWDWRPLEWLTNAKRHGIVAQLNILHVPRWLSHNGEVTGVPLDWGAWDDIIGVIVSRHADLIDSVDLLNEPLTPAMLDISNTKYQSNERAAGELYRRTARCIRTHLPDVLIGGPGEDRRGGEFGSIGTILRDQRIPDDELQFLSYHAYHPDPGSDLRLDDLHALIRSSGRPPLPVYLNEWNHDYDPDSAAPEIVGRRAVAYTLRTLLSLAQHPQLAGAAFMSALPGDIEIDPDQNAPGLRLNQAIYDWNDDEQATLWPQAAAFRLLSVHCRLGEGPFRSHSLQMTANETIAAFTDACGVRTVIVVNTSPDALLIETRDPVFDGLRSSLLDADGATTEGPPSDVIVSPFGAAALTLAAP